MKILNHWLYLNFKIVIYTETPSHFYCTIFVCFYTTDGII